MGSNGQQRASNASARACSERSTASQTYSLAGLSQRCPRQESNLDLPLRRRSSYPLDYEGVKGRLPTGGGQITKRLAIQAVGDPLVHRLRAEPPVEAERERVPVERRPLQPLAATLAHERRDRLEQRFAHALATVSRAHEQILEPHACTGEEARESRKEQGVAQRSRVAFGDQRLGGRARAEQRLAQLFLGGAQLVLQVLVLGQLFKQLEQQRHILRLSGADPQRVEGSGRDGVSGSVGWVGQRSGRSGETSPIGRTP